jgi:hypothetical protein
MGSLELNDVESETQTSPVPHDFCVNVNAFAGEGRMPITDSATEIAEDKIANFLFIGYSSNLRHLPRMFSWQ